MLARSERVSRDEVVVDFSEKRVDAIFADLDQCQLPGAAVGIAIHGRPMYRKGFGLASMELPVVLSPRMRMRIYSTTKQFPCLAYMLLCEQGKAGIDDPIGKHIPELHPVAHNVAMRQLMGNVGGLRDVHDINWQFGGVGRPVSTAELLALYRDIDDVNFLPGTAWVYNNGGFLLLSVAIERITGQPLEEVLRERIFEPIGMHDSLLRRFDTDFVPNSATMHMVSPTGRYEKSYIGTDTAGAGGIVSTVDDMLRWLAHMDAPRVGNTHTWTLMKTPQRLLNGTSTGYGLGLFVSLYRGVEVVHHAGGSMGANSQMLKVPAAGLDIDILVNRHDVSAAVLANQVLDACLPNLEPAREVSVGTLATGIFRSPRTGRVIQLFAREGQQTYSTDGGSEMPLEVSEGGVLRPSGPYQVVNEAITVLGDSASPPSIRVRTFGNVDELFAVRLADRPNVASIVGEYRSRQTGTHATILDADDGPQLHATGRFGSVIYQLNCLGEGLWQAKSKGVRFLGGILSFDGRGGGFRFSNYSTTALPFARCA
jgi:D-aminopeptidase